MIIAIAAVVLALAIPREGICHSARTLKASPLSHAVIERPVSMFDAHRAERGNEESSGNSCNETDPDTCPMVSNNTTDTQTAMSPRKTPLGTSPQCTAWYPVSDIESVSGCGGLERKYNITKKMLYELNPDINADCTNLLLGFDYCVGGRLFSVSGYFDA